MSDFNKLHLFRVPETKASVDQSDVAVLKKLKNKKRRLKEDSRRCSDGHNGDADTEEPTSKKNATPNGKSKHGKGARELHRISN